LRNPTLLMCSRRITRPAKVPPTSVLGTVRPPSLELPSIDCLSLSQNFYQAIYQSFSHLPLFTRPRIGHCQESLASQFASEHLNLSVLAPIPRSSASFALFPALPCAPSAFPGSSSPCHVVPPRVLSHLLDGNAGSLSAIAILSASRLSPSRGADPLLAGKQLLKDAQERVRRLALFFFGLGVVLLVLALPPP